MHKTLREAGKTILAMVAAAAALSLLWIGLSLIFYGHVQW